MDNLGEFSTKLHTSTGKFCTKVLRRRDSRRKFVTLKKSMNKNKSLFKHPVKVAKLVPQHLQKLSTNSHYLIQPLLNLYINFTKESAGEKLSIILFLILPWNIGKHFEISASYLEGTLIPYLVPTLYLQDILVIFVTLASLTHKSADRISSRWNTVSVRLVLLFLLACLFSLFFARRSTPSLYFLCRLGLYLVFFITSADLFRKRLVRQMFFSSIVVNLLLLSLLSAAQFANQSAVFKNYLFFGEQPYNIYTPFIAKESYGGAVKIPPYGTFEHPNILAGYLVVTLTFLAGWFCRQEGKRLILSAVGLVLFSVGVYVVFLTKSTTAQVGLIFGGVFLLGCWLVERAGLHRRMGSNVGDGIGATTLTHGGVYKSVVILIGAGIVVVGLAFPLLKSPALKLMPTDSTQSQLSVDRRALLLTASYQMFLQKPFFGWGLNSFTYSSQPFYTDPVLTRFYQPVHNIFALILVETGIFGLTFFLALIFYMLHQTTRHNIPFYTIALLQIIFLASFDHYFFTIHQTLLLLILTLMLSLTYTKDTNCL